MRVLALAVQLTLWRHLGKIHPSPLNWATYIHTKLPTWHISLLAGHKCHHTQHEKNFLERAWRPIIPRIYAGLCQIPIDPDFSSINQPATNFHSTWSQCFFDWWGSLPGVECLREEKKKASEKSVSHGACRIVVKPNLTVSSQPERSPKLSDKHTTGKERGPAAASA